jgi:hypothetical protein
VGSVPPPGLRRYPVGGRGGCVRVTLVMPTTTPTVTETGGGG